METTTTRPAASQSARRLEVAAAFAFLGALLATLVIYWQGLGGAFLLDDPLNIGLVVHFPRLPDLTEIYRCARSGQAGGLGRPLAQLTFCAQHYSWPDDPWAFKFANVMLHLINGCLVFWFLLRVGRLLRYSGPVAAGTALLAASVWMLHPILVSTVLYSVQRMTEMATLFSLVGLILYVVGREAASLGRPVTGYAEMSAGLLFGGFAAAFSKESGLLLPLFALVIEATLFSRLAKPAYWRLWSVAFLVAPTALVFGYIAWHFDALVTKTYLARDFTLPERLLTQSNVLWDYMFKLVWPFGQQFRLFHDDFPIARTPIASLDVMIPAIAWMAALLASVLWRKRFPVASFGVLWFAAGHTFESTFLPLEIYYEHRNYMPSIGLLFSLAHAPVRLASMANSVIIQRSLSAASAGMVMVLAFLSWNQTTLWGQPLAQAAVWSSEGPRSKRSREMLGEMWAKAGRPDKAEAAYRNLMAIDPSDAAADLYLIHLGCHFPSVQIPDLGSVVKRLEMSTRSNAILSNLAELVALRQHGQCQRVSGARLYEMIEALRRNPRFAPRRNNLDAIQANLASETGGPDGPETGSR